MNTLDEVWMRLALDQAERAEKQGEVPVGAVIVLNDVCIAKAYNCSIQCCDPCAHAEIVALRQAGERIGNYRLLDCTMYVTLEPCAMCVGAMIHARIERLVYAASDPKTGAVESVIRLLSNEMHNHRIEVTSGVRKDESSKLLKQFFRQRRAAKDTIDPR